MFGSRPGAVEAAGRYVDHLSTTGAARGLIGPREVPRVWERHVLNSALVAHLVPRGARVIDVGSGAGLPGLPLAIARQDLDVVLLEPAARRVAWLSEVIEDLGLGNVAVVRGRAEDVAEPGPFHVKHADVVTARAVAPLDRLVAWCLPLVAPGGQLLALKGRSAADELAQHEDVIRRSRAQSWDIVTVGSEVVAVPTTVVRVTVGSGAPVSTHTHHARRRKGHV